jgi:hypothetical protein
MLQCYHFRILSASYRYKIHRNPKNRNLFGCYEQIMPKRSYGTLTIGNKEAMWPLKQKKMYYYGFLLKKDQNAHIAGIR